MLSFLLEKFIRRLCGRWLRDFSAKNFTISLGGSIEFKDVWLDTSELSKMLLPFEPIMAHAGRLRIELPLSLTGTLSLYVDDVDVLLSAQSYEVDAEAARRAVEIAVNLYWANYLRAPAPTKQSKDGEEAVADVSVVGDTILALLRAARVVVRRLHVRVESKTAKIGLADGLGQRLAAGFVTARIVLGDSEQKKDDKDDKDSVSKKCDFFGVAAYCGADDSAPRRRQQSEDAAAVERAERVQALKSVRKAWAGEPPLEDASYFGGMMEEESSEAREQGFLLTAKRAAKRAAARSFDLVFVCATLSVQGRLRLDLATALAEQTPRVSLDAKAPSKERRSRSQNNSATTTHPWIKEAQVEVAMGKVEARLTPHLIGFVLETAERLAHAHRRRQDVSRRFLRREATALAESVAAEGETSSDRSRRGRAVLARWLWAHVTGFVLCDDAHKKRLARSSDARRSSPATWRRWFEEWRRAARYVAIRKLLKKHVRCGVFRDESSGEAYYELGESSCVTKRGKFYVHPHELDVQGVRTATRSLNRKLRPAHYKPPPRKKQQPASDAALSSWREMTRSRASTTPRAGSDDEPTTPREQPTALEPRMALALYAIQLRYDSVLPAARAAAFRAIAARHLSCARAANAERRAIAELPESYCFGSTLLIAPLSVEGLPLTSSWTMEDTRDFRVDVTEGPHAFRSAKPSTLSKSTAEWSSSWRELPAPNAGGVVTLGLVDIGVTGTYETSVGTSSIDVDEFRVKKPTVRELFLKMELPQQASIFGGSASTHTVLRVAVCVASSDAEISRARKAMDGHLARREEAVESSSATTARVTVKMADSRFELFGDVSPDVSKKVLSVHVAHLKGTSGAISIRGADSHESGGSGEGCVLAAIDRFWRAALLSTSSSTEELWRASGVKFDSDLPNVLGGRSEDIIARRINVADFKPLSLIAPNGSYILTDDSRPLLESAPTTDLSALLSRRTLVTEKTPSTTTTWHLGSSLVQWSQRDQKSEEGLLKAPLYSVGVCPANERPPTRFETPFFLLPPVEEQVEVVKEAPVVTSPLKEELEEEFIVGASDDEEDDRQMEQQQLLAMASAWAVENTATAPSTPGSGPRTPIGTTPRSSTRKTPRTPQDSPLPVKTEEVENFQLPSESECSSSVPTPPQKRPPSVKLPPPARVEQRVEEPEKKQQPEETAAAAATRTSEPVKQTCKCAIQ